MVNIYSYIDCRIFLRDFLEGLKKETPRFSLRHLSLKAGINAGNFTRMLKGERNLSLASAIKLARALKLNKHERDYFQSMVLFCHAKNHEDKKRYFEDMMSFKGTFVRVLDADQYEFYEKWYYSAVREALAFFPCNDKNPAELGKLLEPAISGKEVGRAIALLQKLGLIKKNSEGYYQRTDALISTGNNVKSIALNNFVINAMKLAEQAINRNAGNMNLSTVTLSISGEGFQKAQEEVRTFRRRIMEIARESPGPDRVYQFNMQVFPLTREHDKSQS